VQQGNDEKCKHIRQNDAAGYPAEGWKRHHSWSTARHVSILLEKKVCHAA